MVYILCKIRTRSNRGKKKIDYINNTKNIELHTPLMVEKMIITDIERRILNEDRGPQPVVNRIKIEMILPFGNYILELI